MYSTMCSHQNPPIHVSPRVVPVTFGHHPIYGMPLFFYRWLKLKFTQTQAQAQAIANLVRYNQFVKINLSALLQPCRA